MPFAARPLIHSRPSASSRDGVRGGAWMAACGSGLVGRVGLRQFPTRPAAGPFSLSPAGRALLVLVLLAPALPAAAQDRPSVSSSAERTIGRDLPPGPCVQVEIGAERVGHLECASQALQAAARTAQAQARSAFEVPVPEAGSPDVRVGVSSLSGARLRLGSALGTSVHRPVPPRAPGAPRAGDLLRGGA